MSIDYKMTLTYAGHDLLLPHIASEDGKVFGDIIFSRIVASDILIEDGFDIRSLESIENAKMELPITNCTIQEYNGERCALLEAAMQSFKLEEGFQLRILGIYATDPYTGKEILYAVSHFPQIKTITEENGVTSTRIEETGEWIPTITEGKLVDILFTLITVIGQAENVVCNIVDDIVHVTIKEFRDHIDSKNPHDNMPHLAGQINGEVGYFLGKNEGDDNFYQIPFTSVINQILPETVSKIGVSGDATGTVSTDKKTGSTDIKLTNIRATQLKTSRRISITGKASGSAMFDGTTNITITLSGVDADTLSGKSLSYIMEALQRMQNTVNSIDDGLPIGTILAYGGDIDDIPTGWHLCDGENGTPDLRDRFLMGWGGNAAGKAIEAGLPNIRGTFGADDRMSIPKNAEDGRSNAFKSLKGADTGSEGRDGGRMIEFDASQYNPIYGKSDTVQPPSYTVYYIMKTGT